MKIKSRMRRIVIFVAFFGGVYASLNRVVDDIKNALKNEIDDMLSNFENITFYGESRDKALRCLAEMERSKYRYVAAFHWSRAYLPCPRQCLTPNEAKQLEQRVTWYFRDPDFVTQPAQLVDDIDISIDGGNALIISNVTFANRGFYYCLDTITNRTYSKSFLDIRKLEHRRLISRERTYSVPMSKKKRSPISEASYSFTQWTSCNRCYHRGQSPIDGESYRFKMCQFNLQKSFRNRYLRKLQQILKGEIPCDAAIVSSLRAKNEITREIVEYRLCQRQCASKPSTRTITTIIDGVETFVDQIPSNEFLISEGLPPAAPKVIRNEQNRARGERVVLTCNNNWRHGPRYWVKEYTDEENTRHTKYHSIKSPLSSKVSMDGQYTLIIEDIDRNDEGTYLCYTYDDVLISVDVVDIDKNNAYDELAAYCKLITSFVVICLLAVALTKKLLKLSQQEHLRYRN